jgi:hypothetical protein
MLMYGSTGQLLRHERGDQAAACAPGSGVAPRLRLPECLPVAIQVVRSAVVASRLPSAGSAGRRRGPFVGSVRRLKNRNRQQSVNGRFVPSALQAGELPTLSEGLIGVNVELSRQARHRLPLNKRFGHDCRLNSMLHCL